MLDIAEKDLRKRVRTVLAYHRRTKHRPDGYAAGPGTLDWDAQPCPYRHFAGAPVTSLPLASGGISTPFAALTGQSRVAAVISDRRSVGALLELSFGLAAVKEYGPDSWALRCNPSSGNLHPTEAYVLAGGIGAIADGVHHYRPREHALEQRLATRLECPGLWIGLSSIQWREAWKYGERAFRYCQLDLGHALGALTAACDALGWRAHVVPGIGTGKVGQLLGLDRTQDFGRAEREEPEVLVRIETGPEAGSLDSVPVPACPDDTGWTGVANLLDPHPMYRWPVIEAAAEASRGMIESIALHAGAPTVPAPQARAAEIILKRRSAQRYARDHVLPRGTFARVLDSVSQLLCPSRLHLLAYAHNVEGLDRGLYALPRDPASQLRLRAALDSDLAWQEVAVMPEVPALRLLAKGDFRKLVRALTCHQAIAADACVTFCMLAELDDLESAGPWLYRHLHWQAGLIGHRLYLEAEALGLGGTGIGCFLDDEVHRLLGLTDETFQAIYHFALGRALVDERISSAPAYPGRSRSEAPW
ncbi:nitroreductase family protein [Novosphingobium mangrovi (ex Huang et al. 2023)]|uniref:Nitroreductase family protein n=1 Tax=Novosphingobium mangrovi (ex Huang et al. 2023) TaxID=2976432 RepID=A0ABT2I271_9SPHN|nr:nitroreductase family protein [Novosphingobium mangrovi (ex Huang et al. 2023)]MCT2398904.1 nitroreductase family protein [Novosphingobium mangrovi (ex Huang et al. 2023)]